MVKIRISESNEIHRDNITIYMYGTSNEIFVDPKDPNSEFSISLSGPLTSFVLVFVFIGLWALNKYYFNVNELGVSFFILFEANMALCILNLLPYFPFDGGRITRSILWGINNDFKRSTLITITIGKFLSFFIIMFGVFEILAADTMRGFWTILIGVFLFQAANQVYFEERVKSVLTGLNSRDLINRDIFFVSPFLTVDDVINEYFVRYASMSFPVVSSNQVLGLISLRDIRRNAKYLHENSRVGEVMRSFPPGIYIFENTFVIHALKLMISYNISLLPVRKNGKLVGILTLDKIAGYIEEKV